MPNDSLTYVLTRRSTGLERQYGAAEHIRSYAPFLPDVGLIKRVKYHGLWWDVLGVTKGIN